jgi:hypothetical protein
MSKAGTRYLGAFYRVPVRNLIESSLLLISLVCVAAVAKAEPNSDSGTSSWYLEGGAYVHFSNDEDYEGPPLFVGIEHRDENLTLIGFSVFNNSFGDFSQYVYVGKQFQLSQKYPGFRFKITAGIVRGYEDEHHEILPIRWGDSWGLGAVPTIGYQGDRVGFDVAVLSASGLLFLVGYEF